jgi:hypothetical protein
MSRTTIQAESTKKEYRKFFAVLFFIFLASTLMSTLITFRWEDWIRWYVGSSLLVFGGFKLISYESFLQVFPRYDPLASRYSWYAHIYPLLEVMLGIFFILDIAPSARYIVTFVMLAFGLVGMVTNLQRLGPSTKNTWLGNVFKLPMTTAILFEDAIVGVLAAILLIAAII